MKFGIVFCGVCDSVLVDSGFDSKSSLKCCECNNEKVFKIGKVSVEGSIDVNHLIEQAKKEAGIIH
jgi:hypothetical protein